MFGFAGMSPVEQMNRIIDCWARAEKRAKHLCAFETLGLNIRCRKPSQEEVKKAWHRLCVRLHPDKNSEYDALATEATRCINLAKQHLFEEHFGDADARVTHKHEHRAAEAAKAASEAAEAAAAAQADDGPAEAAQPLPAEQGDAQRGASAGKRSEPDAPASVPLAANSARAPSAEDDVEQEEATKRQRTHAEPEVEPQCA